MKAEISKTFRFDAAHRLLALPAGHKCAGPHGHSYHVTIIVAGEVDPDVGWVMDFGRIKQVVQPLIDQVDHADLNEIEGLGNPTSEHIAKWFWDRVKTDLPGLSAVTVAESDTSTCTYRGQ